MSDGGKTINFLTSMAGLTAWQRLEQVNLQGGELREPEPRWLEVVRNAHRMSEMGHARVPFCHSYYN